MAIQFVLSHLRNYLWLSLERSYQTAASSNWFLSLKAADEDPGLEKAHRHAHGLNQLHCFADPTVSWDVVDHYQFEWWKNGDTQIGSSQNLIEYQEKLSKPPGLVLTLGKIEVIIYLFFFFRKKNVPWPTIERLLNCEMFFFGIFYTFSRHLW